MSKYRIVRLKIVFSQRLILLRDVTKTNVCRHRCLLDILYYGEIYFNYPTCETTIKPRSECVSPVCQKHKNIFRIFPQNRKIIIVNHLKCSVGVYLCMTVCFFDRIIYAGICCPQKRKHSRYFLRSNIDIVLKVSNLLDFIIHIFIKH